MSWVDASDLLIGPIDFATANTVSYTLPDLPDNVDQVLIFIWGYSGAATGSFSRLFDIWTAESSGLKYRMKFFIFSYPQNAIGFNSDNIWLPLTSERRLYVKQTSSVLSPQNCTGSIQLIGYSTRILP